MGAILSTISGFLISGICGLLGLNCDAMFSWGSLLSSLIAISGMIFLQSNTVLKEYYNHQWGQYESYYEPRSKLNEIMTVLIVLCTSFIAGIIARKFDCSKSDKESTDKIMKESILTTMTIPIILAGIFITHFVLEFIPIPGIKTIILLLTKGKFILSLIMYCISLFK